MVTYWLLQANQGAPMEDPLVIVHSRATNSTSKGSRETNSSGQAAVPLAVAIQLTPASERSDSSGSSTSSSRQRAASNPDNQHYPPAQRARGETIQVSPQDLSRHLGKLDRLRVAVKPTNPSFDSSSRGTLPTDESRRQSSWSELPESRRTSWQRVKRGTTSDSGQTSPSNHPWSPRSDGDSAQGMELSPMDDMPTRSRSISRDFCVQIDAEGSRRPSAEERRGSAAHKRPSHMVVPMEVLLEDVDERESRYSNSTTDLTLEAPSDYTSSPNMEQMLRLDGLPRHINLEGTSWQVSCL
jgi:hypothetical protein